MLHPFLHLVTARPGLLADHAEAYAGLLSSELGSAGAYWRRQMVLNAAALCCLGVGTVLAGVALMLWAVLPTAQMPAPWALLAVPLPPIAAALVCLWLARRQAGAEMFGHFRRQLAADMAMFQEAAAA